MPGKCSSVAATLKAQGLTPGGLAVPAGTEAQCVEHLEDEFNVRVGVLAGASTPGELHGLLLPVPLEGITKPAFGYPIRCASPGKQPRQNSRMPELANRR